MCHVFFLNVHRVLLQKQILVKNYHPDFINCSMCIFKMEHIFALFLLIVIFYRFSFSIFILIFVFLMFIIFHRLFL